MRSIRQNREVEFDISYTSKEITPWGMVFLKQMLQKTGFRELVEQNTDLYGLRRILSKKLKNRGKQIKGRLV